MAYTGRSGPVAGMMRGGRSPLSVSRVEGANGGHNFQHRIALLGAILRARKKDVQKCGLTA